MRRPVRSIAIQLLIALLLLCAAPLCAQSEAEPEAADEVAASAPEAEEPVEPIRFDLWEIQVVGNSVLDPMEVERAVYWFLGPDRSEEDVDRAVESLSSTYRAAGYESVLVNIPPQDPILFNQGVVVLEIIEGRVESVAVSGADYFSPRQIRDAVPALSLGGVPHLPTVQEQLDRVNAQNRDRTVTPVARPGRTPGTSEWELRVSDEQPLHGSIELNNRKVKDTSESRLNANISYDNLWLRNHSLSLGIQTAPQEPSEARVFSATYSWPMGDKGDRMVLYGVHSKSDISTVGDLLVIGAGDIVGLRAAIPLRGTDRLFHGLAVGADYKSFGQSVEDDGEVALETPIHYFSLAADYNGTLIGDRTLNRFGIGLHLAPRGLGNENDEFDTKRLRAEPNFAYLTGKFEHERELGSGDSPSANYRIHGRLQGQWSNGPLVSNEQFSVGGSDGPRGYTESLALGDDGLRGSLELRTPSWIPGPLAGHLKELRLLAFLDAATLRSRDVQAGTRSRTTLSGSGIGLRARGTQGLYARADLARALAGLDPVEAGDLRLHVAAGYEF